MSVRFHRHPYDVLMVPERDILRSPPARAVVEACVREAYACGDVTLEIGDDPDEALEALIEQILCGEFILVKVGEVPRQLDAPTLRDDPLPPIIEPDLGSMPII